MIQIAAYVIAKNGELLAPIHSYPRVKKFIKNGKAKVVSYKPYTIQLTYDIECPVVPELHLGVDTGRENIGLQVIKNNGESYYSAHVITSNREVPKHMADRKAHRQASRRGERKVRQRRAIKNDTVFNDSNTRERILPQCESPIVNNYIINSEARFCNRKRPEGWLTPTARHLLETHLKTIDEACKLLPIKDITIEVTKWDFAKMENPNIKNWEYQKGKLFGCDCVEEAVYARQNGHCLMCKKPIDAYHHIVPRYLGGSESVDNRCGLCESCHAKVHTYTEFEQKLKTKQQGLLKKYGALSVMNQIVPYLLKEVVKRYPDKEVYITTGYDTASLRKTLGLPKTHTVDAWCIAASQIDLKNVKPTTVADIKKDESFKIKQFRRQDRALIHAQTERTYKYNGETVAKNRHKRFEQKDDSLEEWFDKQVKLYSIKEAERMRSQLTVKKSKRNYNNPSRIMPGAVFLHNGERFVMSGQRTRGQYYLAVGDAKTNHPAKDCIIVRQNTGLVYL